ncbi:MAG TPA: hypothetical protein VGJ09_07930, partial [Bryobacteraceae bacterium]
MTRLATLRVDPSAPAAATELSKALSSKANVLVARAGDIIREARLTSFVDPMITAFDRFMVDAASTDKGCAAKTAIARALYELESRAENTFL